MDTDISKIVSLIMENPDLIEKIKSLAKGEEKKAEDGQEAESVSAPALTYPADDGSKTKRRQLLSALKPYLSAERSRAIDSMMNISDVIEIARRR